MCSGCCLAFVDHPCSPQQAKLYQVAFPWVHSPKAFVFTRLGRLCRQHPHGRIRRFRSWLKTFGSQDACIVADASRKLLQRPRCWPESYWVRRIKAYDRAPCQPWRIRQPKGWIFHSVARAVRSPSYQYGIPGIYCKKFPSRKRCLWDKFKISIALHKYGKPVYEAPQL